MTTEDKNDATTAVTHPTSLNELLGQSMSLTDVIHNHELSNQLEEWSIRSILTTPGVKQGFIAAAICTAVAIPSRRLFLHVCRRRLNLGTVLPDLIATPLLTLLTLQCTLLSGSCYGSAAYLDRLAQIPTTAPSPMADAICNDPAFIRAMTGASTDQPRYQQFAESKKIRSWDPRTSNVLALDKALQSCRERLDYQQQIKNASAAEDDKLQVERESRPASRWFGWK